jgi:hypothetical protein
VTWLIKSGHGAHGSQSKAEFGFRDIPVEPWRAGLLERGFPVHVVNHLATMADLHREQGDPNNPGSDRASPSPGVSPYLRAANTPGHFPSAGIGMRLSQGWDSEAGVCLYVELLFGVTSYLSSCYEIPISMAHPVLFLDPPHERGEIRLFNVACLRCVLRPARS